MAVFFPNYHHQIPYSPANNRWTEFRKSKSGVKIHLRLVYIEKVCSQLYLPAKLHNVAGWDMHWRQRMLVLLHYTSTLKCCLISGRTFSVLKGTPYPTKPLWLGQHRTIRWTCSTWPVNMIPKRRNCTTHKPVWLISRNLPISSFRKSADKAPHNMPPSPLHEFDNNDKKADAYYLCVDA